MAFDWLRSLRLHLAHWPACRRPARRRRSLRPNLHIDALESRTAPGEMTGLAAGTAAAAAGTAAGPLDSLDDGEISPATSLRERDSLAVPPPGKTDDGGVPASPPASAPHDQLTALTDGLFAGTLDNLWDDLLTPGFAQQTPARDLAGDIRLGSAGIAPAPTTNSTPPGRAATHESPDIPADSSSAPAARSTGEVEPLSLSAPSTTDDAQFTTLSASGGTSGGTSGGSSGGSLSGSGSGGGSLSGSGSGGGSGGSSGGSGGSSGGSGGSSGGSGGSSGGSGGDQAAPDPPVFSVTASILTGSETGPRSAAFTFRRGEPRSYPETVYYSASGTATSGSDYTGLSGNVTIPADEMSTTVYVSVVDDLLVEGDETVTVTLTPDASYTIGTQNTATVTINDNDPTLSITATDASAAEAGADPGQFTVSRNAPAPTELTVHYTVGGTATAGDDYAALSGTVAIPADATSAVIDMSPIDDALGDGDETVVLTLASDPAYFLGQANSATAIIADNDFFVSIAASDPHAAETGANPGRLTVSRDTVGLVDLTVLYSVGGTATIGQDYAALSGSVVIPAGATSALIDVDPIDDALAEGDETVVVTLAADPAYFIDQAGSATVTVADDEPVVSIAATDPHAAETGTNPGRFTVSREAVGSVDATVFYTVAGTATSGEDYAALSGSVVIPAGTLSAAINIDPLSDSVPEWSETVTVSLAASSQYLVGPDDSATVTIKSDQSLLQIDVVAIPGTGIQLDWPDAADETVYRIYRTTVGTDERIEIGTTEANVVTLTDTAAVADTAYIYHVAAETAAGSSLYAESEPIKALSAQGDEDADGLSNLDEYNLGTDIFYFDTDGDLLSDGWEVRYALDPLDADQNANGLSDGQDDFDGDTLNNLDESNLGTDPMNLDTDGDGTWDGVEVDQGSLPRDPTDGGQPPADDMKGKFRLKIGDPSGSHSERWKFRIDDIGERQGDYSTEFAAPDFGEVGTDDFWFQAGESYEVRIDHLGTDPDFLEQWGEPDFDWVAWIEPTPGEEPLPYFIVDENDPKILQETETHGDDENLVVRRVADFHIPLLDADVDSDNDNGFSEPGHTPEEDRLEQSPAFGKRIVTTTGDIDDDGITDNEDFGGITGARFVPLTLGLSENLDDAQPSSVELTLSYDETVLRVWTKDAAAARTAADWIRSGVAVAAGDLGDSGLRPGGEVTLYVEAIARADNAVPITVSADVDGQKWNGTLTDKVHMLVISGGLTAYRPQVTTQDHSQFDLFGLQAVSDDDEAHRERGPGIRRNGGNDDDQNGEDDHILFTVADVNTPDGTFRLRRGSNALRVFSREQEITFEGDTTGELSLVGGEAFLSALWDGTTHGTADLELIDPATDQVIDTLTFHTFRSHVIMIMGFTQDAQQGSVSGPGTEAAAKVLYKEGYDVHLYEWHEQQDIFDTWYARPEKELETAVTDRGIEQFVMMGYSYGGGTVYDMSTDLYDGDDAWITNAEFALSVYVDAVNDATVDPDAPNVIDADPEQRKPRGSLTHANYYQLIDEGTGQLELNGVATTAEVGTATILDNDDMSQDLLNAGIAAGSGHTAIDSFGAVTAAYLGHIRSQLVNR